MSSPRPQTARARLVAVLTEEILQNPSTSSYAIASEHELCRQHQISRVTVRLALSDLENRGLIYRKHGKGTFAHGRSSRLHRNLCLLVKNPPPVEHRPLAELIRGIQTALAPLGAGLLVLGTSPEEWRPELASSLGGVIVVPEGVSARDLEIFRDRKLPFLLIGESHLSGPRIVLGLPEAPQKLTDDLLTQGGFDFFTAGKGAAAALDQVSLTGQPVDDLVFARGQRPDLAMDSVLAG